MLEDGQELAQGVGLDGDLGQQCVDLLAPPLGQAEVDLPLEEPPERSERVDLSGQERAGHVVEHAQRADGVPSGRHQWDAGVEADSGVADHQWIVGEPGVVQGVPDDEHFAGSEDGVGAERHVPRGLGDIEAERRLEPLPVGVDQADESRRGPGDPGGESDGVVERGLRSRVEQTRGPELGQTCLFVLGKGRGVMPETGTTVRLPRLRGPPWLTHGGSSLPPTGRAAGKIPFAPPGPGRIVRHRSTCHVSYRRVGAVAEPIDG